MRLHGLEGKCELHGGGPLLWQEGEHSLNHSFNFLVFLRDLPAVLGSHILKYLAHSERLDFRNDYAAALIIQQSEPDNDSRDHVVPISNLDPLQARPVLQPLRHHFWPPFLVFCLFVCSFVFMR